MKQLVQECKWFTIDSLDIDDTDQFSSMRRKEELSIKEIYNDLIFNQSGRLLISNPKINEDCRYFHELKHINYLFITSNKEFNLIINDSVMLNLKQFTYVNNHKNISISIQESPLLNHYIEYVYGQFKLGNESTGFKTISQDIESPARFDRVLNNIIFTVNNSNDNNIINCSNISNYSAEKFVFDVNSSYDSIYNPVVKKQK